jgi:putative ABC transport system permease protein
MKLLNRLRELFRKEELDQELSDELAFHLEKQIEQNLAAGMSAEEARYAALRSFGGVEQVKEECRDAWGVRFIDTLLRDIRFGLRMLAKNPGFTAVAVLTLALGIGANTAIFSVVEAVLLRPLPFHDPANLVQLFETERAPGNYPLTGADYLDWQAQTRTLEGTSLFSWGKSCNASGAAEPEQAYVVRTQANFFSLLGVEPLIGRTFLAGEDQAGRNSVAILSYGFWQRHLGGGKDAVGKDLDLDGEKYNVVGVMPAWFGVLGGADIWIPMDMSGKNLGPRGTHQYRAIGRLKRGIPMAKARAELQTIAQRLEKQYPNTNSKVGAEIVPLKEQLVGGSQAELLILLGAVGLVLLIACANVANLSLVRATGRHREIAVRRAIGAGRGRVVRQLLTESVLLSLLGAALGVLIGWGCLRLLASAEALPIPRANPITLDGAVLAFTLAVGLLVGVLVGLAPALHVSQLRLNEELKTSVQAVLGPSGPRHFLCDALVAGEIATSLILQIGASLLLRSFAKLREVDIGIHPQGVLTAQIALPPKKYTTLEQGIAFYDQLLDGLKGAPGVKGPAVGSKLPLWGGSNGYITIEGEEGSQFNNILVENTEVSPDYFRVFGIPFLKGRNFAQQDFQGAAESARMGVATMQSGKLQASPGPRLVAVINQTMAHQFWPNQDPLGKRFKLWGGMLQVTVIGVVGDVKEWGIREPVIPQAYYPLPFALAPPVGALSVIVRGAVGTKGLPATVRNQVYSLDSSLALFNVRTMQEVISRSMTDTNYQSLLLSSFALLALLLTSVGIYGVMAYMVTQRTHEIGIRLALGAHRREILRLILHQGAQLTLTGVGFGVAGALVLTRFLSSLLFGIQSRDPFTFVVVTTGLAAVALLASYIPAGRATKVDPMVALRYE